MACLIGASVFLACIVAWGEKRKKTHVRGSRKKNPTQPPTPSGAQTHGKLINIKNRGRWRPMRKKTGEDFWITAAAAARFVRTRLPWAAMRAL